MIRKMLAPVSDETDNDDDNLELTHATARIALTSSGEQNSVFKSREFMASMKGSRLTQG